MRPDDLDTMRQWFELCHRGGIGLVDASTMGEQLLGAYTDAARRYHDLGHIADTLGLAQRLAMTDDDRLVVEFSIWFHDVVYDPRGTENEARSAELAARWLTDRGLPAIATRVDAIVRATATHAPPDPDDRAACVVHDVDLAMLVHRWTIGPTHRRSVPSTHTSTTAPSRSAGRRSWRRCWPASASMRRPSSPAP